MLEVCTQIDRPGVWSHNHAQWKHKLDLMVTKDKQASKQAKKQTRLKVWEGIC